MQVSNPLDEQYVFAVQDPSDPVWEDDSVIAAMQGVDDPNDEFDQLQPTSVRTTSGVLSFLDDVVDSAGLAEFHTRASPKPKVAPKLDTIGTKELGSDKWRPQTKPVTDVSTQLVVESPTRRYVQLINQEGSDPVYLSAISGAVAGGPNTVVLWPSDAFVYAPMILPTKDNVYAICGTGLTANVSVIEFFDMEC